MLSYDERDYYKEGRYLDVTTGAAEDSDVKQDQTDMMKNKTWNSIDEFSGMTTYLQSGSGPLGNLQSASDTKERIFLGPGIDIKSTPPKSPHYPLYLNSALGMSLDVIFNVFFYWF